MSPEEYKRTLSNYLPDTAVEAIYNFMSRHRVHLHITRKRTSKLGDYRPPQPRHNFHEISVNGDMNKYQFLMVLLHEMGHLHTHLRYGNEVQPHGHEWQQEYAALLIEYRHCFASELATLIDRYSSRIPLSRTLETEIDAKLKEFDEGYDGSPRLLLDDLQPGMIFRLKEQPHRLFKAIEKRRTRWICEDMNDKRQYLVRGSAEVTC